jgi:hypothetical protein
MVEGIGGKNVEEAGHIVVSLARVEPVLAVSTQHVLPHHVHHCLHVIGYTALVTRKNNNSILGSNTLLIAA